MSSREDLRFAVLEDAAALLQMLPAADEIVWPTDKGDVEAVADALAVLAAWRPPPVKASFRRHRRELRRLSPSRSCEGLDATGERVH